MAAGQLVLDSLTTSDPTFSDADIRFKPYRFRATTDGLVTFRMVSTAIDPLIQVWDSAGVVLIDENDDDPGSAGLHSRVTIPARAGQWYLLVATSFAEELGRFTLHLQHERVNAPRPEPSDTVGRPSPRQVTISKDSIRRMADSLRIVAPCPIRSSADNPLIGALGTDFAHPRYFTRMEIIENDGTRTVVHWPLAGIAETLQPAPHAEADRDSKVFISFDHHVIGTTRDEANINVTARLNGRKVEVPGYSVIGEKSRSSTGRIRRIAVQNTVLCGITESWSKFGADAHVSAEWGNQQYVAYARGLVSRARELEIALEAATGYAVTAMRDAARIGGVDDPEVLLQGAVIMKAHLAALPRDSTLSHLHKLLDQWHLLARQAETWLAAFRRGAGGGNGDPLKALQLRSLKETEIDLSSIGAKHGDTLVITIENDAESDTLPRTLMVNVAVTQYGLNSFLTTTASLIKRVGVSASSTGQLVRSLKSRASNGQVPEDTTFPSAHDFRPAPGTSFGWSWYPRDVGGSELWTDVFRFLHIGGGVHVTTPVFSTTRFTFKPPTAPATDSAAASLQGQPTREVQFEEDGQDFAIGVGPFISLFNNRIQFALGWNLNVGDARRYWSIGLNIPPIARFIADAVSGAGGQ